MMPGMPGCCARMAERPSGPSKKGAAGHDSPPDAQQKDTASDTKPETPGKDGPPSERRKSGLRAFILELYQGDTPRGYHFRFGLLTFDILTILFVVVTSFFPHTRIVEVIDVVLGVVMLADFTARTWMKRGRPLLRIGGWIDIVTVLSFLAPIAGEGFGFLRVLRILRLLYGYRLAPRLRKDSRFFRHYEDAVLASINLFVFIFVVTGFVYISQFRINSEINNYIDALYFTVTSLTTTGYGDVTLKGTFGRLMSVAIMIVGVTLFLRLLQTVFRPRKVRQECETCGLMLHDIDAIHCKHCGALMHIRTAGFESGPYPGMDGAEDEIEKAES